MPEPYKVLFICTGNACRSQMAEALLRRLGGERFIAHSAGTNPAGFVHPLAIEAMRRMGISLDKHRSKPVSEFADEPLDIVLTVCDHAARQPCPNWQGKSVLAHWSLPDPVLYPGPDHLRQEKANEVARLLTDYVRQLVALPIEQMSPQELRSTLYQIAL